MNDLLKKKCIPCEGLGMKPFTKDEAEGYLAQISGWVLDSDGKVISKEFKFKDFIGAINFVNKISEIAEEEGHHPDIHISYNKVRLDISTHAIGGLSENDFILAAKIDAQA
ncbi:MAG TPA: 4a-hydroxytetrahydrobiopterin dehydratase [Candidatus Paceibacterota bacterium]|nr:4a-hydroxytetrahydrobiopterin dehydratase [Candidatus Paceibacterota bacterium]